MALPIRVNFENPFIDIHTGRGQGGSARKVAHFGSWPSMER